MNIPIEQLFAFCNFLLLYGKGFALQRSGARSCAEKAMKHWLLVSWKLKEGMSTHFPFLAQRQKAGLADEDQSPPQITKLLIGSRLLISPCEKEP
jgi:hypothetical protein